MANIEELVPISCSLNITSEVQRCQTESFYVIKNRRQEMWSKLKKNGDQFNEKPVRPDENMEFLRLKKG